jgi:hypothetical protein
MVTTTSWMSAVPTSNAESKTLRWSSSTDAVRQRTELVGAGNATSAYGPGGTPTVRKAPSVSLIPKGMSRLPRELACPRLATF